MTLLSNIFSQVKSQNQYLILDLGHPLPVSATVSGAPLKMLSPGAYIIAVKIQPFLPILWTNHSSRCSFLAPSSLLQFSTALLSYYIDSYFCCKGHLYCDPSTRAASSCTLCSTKDKLLFFSLSSSFIAYSLPTHHLLSSVLDLNRSRCIQCWR